MSFPCFVRWWIIMMATWSSKHLIKWSETQHWLHSSNVVEAIQDLKVDCDNLISLVAINYLWASEMHAMDLAGTPTSLCLPDIIWAPSDYCSVHNVICCVPPCTYNALCVSFMSIPTFLILTHTPAAAFVDLTTPPYLILTYVICIITSFAIAMFCDWTHDCSIVWEILVWFFLVKMWSPSFRCGLSPQIFSHF